MKKTFVVLALFAAVAGSQVLALTGIAGHVYDATTRQPIAGATVCCYVRNARTDSTGFYLISELQPGRYRVRAIMSGYVTGYYPESVNVVEGQVTHGVDFFLTRSAPQHGAISGQVRSSGNGAIIVGAEVRAANSQISRTVSQSADGYLIGELPPGRYRVSATASGFEPGHYPDSVTVVAGQTTANICFHLTPSSGGTGGISGWVFDAVTRQPIRGATVCACTGPVYTDSTGFYLIEDLEPRRYRVHSQAQGYQSANYPESVEVVAGRVTENINFHLQPLAQQHGAISGRVVSRANGEIIAGAIVTAANPHLRRSVTQGPTGYLIPELPAGRYWVSATAREFEPGHYAESVEVVVGRTTGNICFHLEPVASQTGGISGFVTNARTREPVFGARVVAEGPSRGQANTCQRGGYVIRSLLPGRYEVVASARGFRHSAVETVEVVAGRITPEVNFALEPEPGGTGFIIGFVRDSLTNAGINDASVFAWGEAGQGSTYSESCGGYILRELRAGAYLVRAAARGYYHKVFPETVFVVAGETTRNIGFLLRPVQGADGGISGFVFDGERQTAVSNARVTVIGATGSFETHSDASGDYVVDGLEPGEYEIEAEAEGYATEPYPDPVLVETGVIASFISPALYPLTGTAEPAREARIRDAAIRVQNPVRGGAARLQVNGQEAGWSSGPLTVSVLDVSGRALLTSTCELQPSMTLDLGSLPTGIYVVTLRQGSMTATRKLVVQR